MVIDTKRFVPGSSTLQSGLLWIIEQIPGMTQRADVSDVMARQGYWPSYNVPYFEKIYLTSGYNGSCRTSSSRLVFRFVDVLEFEYSNPAPLFDQFQQLMVMDLVLDTWERPGRR